jgi:CheY-like chemotaxis protein
MLKRIFIVDDSKVVRQLVRTYLETRLESIVCTEAPDAVDAIERARTLRPDLIVLDFCMPQMNGMEAAAIFHEMLPKVPIILFTLHKDIVPEKRAKAVGIRSIVSKMDQMDVLLGEVLNFVGVAKSAAASAS